MTAADIAKALGGRSTGGRRYLCPCPVPTHGKGKGDRNPSLSVYDGDEALLITCFAGCERRDVIDELRRRSLLPDTSWQPRPRIPASPAAKTDDDAKRRTEFAMRLWHESKPLNGTPGAAYFTVHRSLDLDRLGDLSHCVRWHAGKRMIVALMHDPLTGVERGIHRIFLNADGTKVERKMLGRAGVVRISPDEDVTGGLALAEGAEDGLAIMLSGWKPIWAATSCGAISRFPVLSGIEALTIFADNDKPGIEAARTCAARWNSARREATILPAKDFRNVETY